MRAAGRPDEIKKMHMHPSASACTCACTCTPRATRAYHALFADFGQVLVREHGDIGPERGGAQRARVLERLKRQAEQHVIAQIRVADPRVLIKLQQVVGLVVGLFVWLFAECCV